MVRQTFVEKADVEGGAIPPKHDGGRREGEGFDLRKRKLGDRVRKQPYLGEKLEGMNQSEEEEEETGGGGGG
jgi:hypothetical protein